MMPKEQKSRELSWSLQKKNEILFVLRSTFRNFATKVANLLRLCKKRRIFFCYALDFS